MSELRQGKSVLGYYACRASLEVYSKSGLLLGNPALGVSIIDHDIKINIDVFQLPRDVVTSTPCTCLCIQDRTFVIK